MELTPALAARLVKKLESTQPYNVVIINKEGIIVGASDICLIGNRHNDAYERINEFLRRSQTGQNSRIRERGNGRCLFVYNQLVGAVGLSGKESQVFPYLEMVKTIAEMFLEREFEIQGKVIQNASLSQVLMRLVSRHSDSEKLQQVLATHQIDMTVPRTLLATRLTPIESPTSTKSPDQTLLFKNAIHNILSLFESRFSFYGDMILPDIENASILVFCADRSQDIIRHDKRLEQLCSLIIEDTRANYRIDAKIIIGKRCCSLSDYDNQYIQLMENFKVAAEIFPHQSILYSKVLVLGNITSCIPGIVKENVVNHTFGKILSNPQKNLYMDTLNAYFDSNMNIGDTARLLDIHRNTLQYRFKKIEELTGYCMYTLDDILTLRLAFLFYKMLPI